MRDYAHLLEFAQQTEILTPQEAKALLVKTHVSQGVRTLHRATQLREGIDSLFRSTVARKPPQKQCLRVLNEFLAGTPVPEIVSWRQPEFVRGYADLTSRPDALLKPIADAAATLLISPDRHCIGECGEPSCRWLFLDRSRNHSRRWCDMRICGNRTKIQRFRVRQWERSQP